MALIRYPFCANPFGVGQIVRQYSIGVQRMVHQSPSNYPYPLFVLLLSESGQGSTRIQPYQQFYAKCSKSRDLTAIAICDSNRESQISSDLRQWGAVPRPLHVGPPGKRSCATVCLETVLVLLRAHVSATCLICCHLMSARFSEVLIATQRTAKCWDKIFGVIVLCWDSYSLLRHRGRFPQWGGTCTPRYCGPLG